MSEDEERGPLPQIEVKYIKSEYSLSDSEISSNEHMMENDNLQNLKVDIRRFPCIFCEKIFKTKYGLDEHLIRLHEEQPIEELITNKIRNCLFCSHRAVNTSSLNSHMLYNHKNKKPFEKLKCAECQYSTISKNALVKHFKVHREEKPLICVPCKLNFRRKNQLDYHIIKKHSDNDQIMETVTSKVHKCELCDYKTTKTSNLKTHYISHANKLTQRT